MKNVLIKIQREIAAIEEACALGDKTFKYILTKIKQDISEIELAFEIKSFIKSNGANISFPPIVGFGANSAFPHHKPTDQRLKSNDQIMLDLGVKLNNYCSDMTRTVFFGKPTREQKRMYQTVLDAQQKATEYLYSVVSSNFVARDPKGISRSARNDNRVRQIKASEVDKAARSYITSQGYPTIPHSLGHGIGTKVHEAPRLSLKSKDILKPGMVFTIEPGIYIPGVGGVRIEDVVLLKESAPRLLTKSSRDLIIL
ncbi:MAG: M24 family metallopeptidase [Patescibacteria group bacterium]